MDFRRYRVALDLDERTWSFSGEVEIELSGAPRDELVLHAAGLAIGSVSVDGAPRSFRLEPDHELLRVDLEGKGADRVAVQFRGSIPERALVGLYRCAYGPGPLITTMLYPNGTRRLFPCWDEPDRKSVFEFQVTADAGAEIIFNTPAASVEIVDGRRRSLFAPTPRMSTYLLYLGVGKFDSLGATVDGVRLELAAPPGRAASGEFSLEHAGRVLAAYNRYYGIPYPLPKLHLVSVPDFWAGAMENWGAIAFHEARLLVDPTTSSRNRRMTRETVTHEIAHQWFGNLVTMQAWNDFWLNESFATFMQAKLDGQLYPELDTWSDFLLRLTSWGLDGDALRTTHPIEVEVPDARALGELADEVSYGKGASVLAMIEEYLGEEPFRRGVSAYLRDHAYGTAVSQDFWHALEAQSELPVARVMERWIRQAGYPVVSVVRTAAGVHLEQHRFLADGTSDEQLWPIPLVYELNGSRGSRLIEDRTAQLDAPAQAEVLVNPRRTGFYRVDYDPPLRAELRARFGRLSPVDRWALMSDAFAFTLAGRWPAAELPEWLRAAAPFPSSPLTGEIATAYIIAEPILARHAAIWTAGREYFRDALDQLEATGRDAKDETTGAVRGDLIFGRVRTDPEFARELAQRLDDLDRVEADLRPGVVYSAGRTADVSRARAMRTALLDAPTEEQARQFATGLASAQDPEALGVALELILDERMPPSRSWAMLVAFARNPAGGARLWSWLPTKLRRFEELQRGTPLLSKFLEGAIPLIGVDRPEEVRQYFSTEQFPEARRGIAKGLELLEVYRAFLARARTDVPAASLA